MTADNLPKVSVIIPVYNGTNYLHEALDSVLLQTYPNVEIIVVDDGSTDETWGIIQGYGLKVRGIKKENGGVASALNCGIQQATGEYIAWLSHDDLFFPNKLERQVAFLNENRQYAACYTDYYVIDAQGKILREIETPWYPRSQVFKQLFNRMYINGSTMLIRRSCLERVGIFTEALRYTQDAEMWLRMLQEFDIGRVPEKLEKQRVHPNQWSKKLEIHKAEEKQMYKRIFEQIGVALFFPELAGSANSPPSRAIAYTWLGNTMSQTRHWFAFANDQYLYAIEIYPSLRNPALISLIRNALHATFHYLRRATGFLRKRV